MSVRSAQIEDVEMLAQLFVHACRQVAAHRGGSLLVQRSQRWDEPAALAQGAVLKPRSEEPDEQLATARSSFVRQLTSASPAPAYRLVIGSVDGVWSGYASASTYGLSTGREIASVDELYVEPGARRRGLGTALLRDVADWATTVGCTGLDGTALPGDRAVKSFFEAVGMRARALVMHRPLAL